MVEIIYSTGKKGVTGEGKHRFMLMDKGSYFYKNKHSKYRGWVAPIKHGKMLKTIDHLKVDDKLLSIALSSNFVREQYEKGTITYMFSQNSLQLQSSFDAELEVYLDVRTLYDFDDQGRIYAVDTSQNRFLVTYEKYANNILEELHHKHVVSISTDCTVTPVLQWKEFHFKEDEQRGSNPTSLYTYHACTIKLEPGKVFFTHAPSQHEMPKPEIKSRSFFVGYNAPPKQKLAVRRCVQTLNELETSQGYFAGLPWFHHIWTRDEAIALGAPIAMKQYSKAKYLLLSHIKKLLDDGRLPNRLPTSELGTADGTGWVFYRLYELYRRKVLSATDKLRIKQQLTNSIRLHKKNHLKDLLIENNPNETWMDTSHDHDTRTGARIEIQALWLQMLEFGNVLGIVSPREVDKTANAIRKHFYQKPILYDGKDDPTIRPNIFLAAYLSPQILKSEEWELAIDSALGALWLDWGGLSTIDKNNGLFTDHYTGENNISYHRGDAWFFINNIAAIVMHRFNKKKYKNNIKKILKASVHDILFDGIPGRPSEISDAAKQNAAASLCQLWSATTFIELIQEMY